MKVKTPKVRLGNIDVLDLTLSLQHLRLIQALQPKSESRTQIGDPMSLMRPLQRSCTKASNLGSGMLTLSCKAKLTGKVELMFIMKKKKSATMDCTMKFDLSSKAIQGLECK
ncbi:hypothetical protein L3X38_028449 [Prunus dulcis]|uniref:Uncharacterized protein n=1 Tax=Prunus dulcis TaxID=3755 RepID=A0AAD4VRS3_PRUDU|nr:hypothetical protein L3X38_028449 [Prunus dulcis]